MYYKDITKYYSAAVQQSVSITVADGIKEEEMVEICWEVRYDPPFLHCVEERRKSDMRIIPEVPATPAEFLLIWRSARARFRSCGRRCSGSGGCRPCRGRNARLV